MRQSDRFFLLAPDSSFTGSREPDSEGLGSNPGWYFIISPIQYYTCIGFKVSTLTETLVI